jgi:hypothetical protein
VFIFDVPPELADLPEELEDAALDAFVQQVMAEVDPEEAASAAEYTYSNWLYMPLVGKPQP